MEETVTTTSISVIVSAANTVVDMVGTVFNAITGNALLTAFAAAGLIGVGISVFARLKRVAK